jgi:hypothetical protein
MLRMVQAASDTKLGWDDSILGLITYCRLEVARRVLQGSAPQAATKQKRRLFVGVFGVDFPWCRKPEYGKKKEDRRAVGTV